MNKNRYRLVFNALRAAWMAVPEGARRAVKRSGGAAVACALALDAVAAPALPRGTLPVPSADPARPFVQHGAVALRTENSAGGRSMDIDQTSRKAVLNWAGFDIAPGSAVRFNQPGADAAVLNKIWSANPSLIQGRLSANGQVYLYNRNGILFDRGAQVNVGGLVASALQIDDSRFLDGLLSRIDGSPAFAWTGTLAEYRASMVQVDLGAQIATADGGSVMLFAPRVDNRGRIETSDGQTILAAGAKVYLTASRDQRLRGLIVEVDPFTAGATTEHGVVANVKPGDDELAGAVAEIDERLQANAAGGPPLTVAQLRQRVGEIFARRGNVTMVAHAVNQAGRVSATTSVNANGSIYLLARDTVSTDPIHDNPATPEVDRLPTRTGTLILGNGSVTEVLPEAGPETSIDAQGFNPSVIDLMGGRIHLQGNAAVVAPGGQVRVAALANPVDSRLAVRGAPPNASRIVMDAGSRIDVSGSTDVVVPMERNVVTAELFAHELRDAPLQRAGILYRKKIKYDLRKGTPIADVKAYEEQIGRTARERTAAGGNVAFSSEGDIVVRQGASVDVSGGWLRYADGFVTTTLLTSGGRVFDIAQATPDRVYDGIFERAPMFVRGYLEGRDAGSVSFASRALALDGTLVGRTTAGPHQRDARGKVAPPAPGRARIGAVPTGLSPDLLLPAIRIARESGALPVGFDAAPLTQSLGARAGEVRIATRSLDGIDHLELYSNEAIVQEADAPLNVGGGGSIVLTGARIEANADLRAPGGSVSLTARTTQRNPGIAGRDVAVGAHVRIGTAGTWTNDGAPAGGGSTSPVWRDGGNVAISAMEDVTLQAGSVVDVSAGAWRGANGALRTGNAGSIAIASNGSAVGAPAGKLVLNGELRGFGFGRGGRLGLAFPSLTIAAAGTGSEWLAPDFFSAHGFGDISLTGIQRLEVADATRIAPQLRSLEMLRAAAVAPSAADMTGLTRTTVLPDARRAAVNLALNSSAGATRIGRGSRIELEPGARLNVAGASSLGFFGEALAPGGVIDLRLTARPTATDTPEQVAQRVLWLDGGARLNAAGTYVATPDPLGLRQGVVLDGGAVSLTAASGYVVAAPGSRIDVAGATTVLDLPADSAGGRPAPTQVSSRGGSVSVGSADGILWDADMQAWGGAATAAGGRFSLRVDLNRESIAEIGTYPAGERTLTLLATGNATPTDIAAGSPLAAARFGGRAALAADRLAGAGFDEIELAAEHAIRLADGAGLHARRSLTLETPRVAAIDNATAQLSAQIFRLVNPDARRQEVAAPVAGTGNLNVFAGLADFQGKLALDGFATARFGAAEDIRLIGVVPMNSPDFRSRGALTGTGALRFEADQIYPATLSEFSIASAGAGSRIEIAGGGGALPLSAGGRLRIEADTVSQAGTLRAPGGTIELVGRQRVDLADGSLTSVAQEGAIIPFGAVENGRTWVYPLGQEANGGSPGVRLFPEPPAKQVKLDAPEVNQSAAARIDLSGGGDLLAHEFLPGLGGSADYLGRPDTYAVLPSYGASFAPHDPFLASGSNAKIGQQIWLAGGGGLAAGTYTLLPGHYALLPGAFVVTPVSGFADMTPAQTRTLADGSAIVAGRLAMAAIGTQDSRSGGYLVETAAIARTKAEYKTYSGNAFFTAAARRGGTAPPRVARDAGQLSISARTAMRLDGRLDFTPADGGRGGLLDIDAPQILVAAGASSAPGFLTLDADRLNAYGAESVLLGGSRTLSGGVASIASGATAVHVDTDGKALNMKELILVARDEVTVSGDSVIAPAGAASGTGDESLALSGDGAALRASSDGVLKLSRSNAGQRGVLRIRDGARLEAAALELDAVDNVLAGGGAVLSADALGLSSARITVGGAGTAPGLNLTGESLQRLGRTQELALRSYDRLDLVGNLAIGAGQNGVALRRLTLDAPVVAGLADGGDANNAVLLRAGEVVLRSERSATDGPAAPVGTGRGTLRIEATGSGGASGNVILADGRKEISGFDTVNLAASGDVIAAGRGALALTGDLDVTARRVAAATGAGQSVHVGGNATIDGNGAAAGDSAGQGGQLALSAAAIVQRGRVEADAGVLRLEARGPGGLTLDAGSLTAARGYARTVDGVVVSADAGRVELAAHAGDVVLRAGADGKPAARVDVSADARGGDAGTWVVQARDRLHLASDASVSGAAGAQGRAGRTRIDVGTIDATGDASLGRYARNLRAGGLTDALALRARSGDVLLAAADTIEARRVEIAADAGRIDVAGAIMAEGGRDAAVELHARDDVRLQSGARIAAVHTRNGVTGGRVVLGTTAGRLRLEAGSRVTVGTQGEIALRAPRIGAGAGTDVAIDPVGATFVGGRAVVVEGVKTYRDNAGVDIAMIASGTSGDSLLGFDSVAGDNAAFLAHGGAIRSRLGLDGDARARVRAGVDVMAAGDLQLLEDWNLRNAAPTGAEPINLTLRAAGNLQFFASLSDGFTHPGTAGNLIEGDSASLRLTGGADLGAANPLAVSPGAGDVFIAADTRVRTGTGRIDVAAGGDIRLESESSALYTAGRATPVATVAMGDPLNPFFVRLTPDGFQLPPGSARHAFPYDGGDVSLAAAGDVIGQPYAQLSSSWLWRQGSLNPAGSRFVGGRSTAWWPRFDLFAQGVGALGGGMVSVTAGRDVVNLSAAAPTSGRLAGDLPDAGRLTVNGGGDVQVSAGRDIRGGQFLAMRGDIDLRAGGSLGQGDDSPTLPVGEVGRWYPILALSDGRARVRAAGDVSIDSIHNPTMVVPSEANVAATGNAAFFTYAPGAGADLSSAGGSVNYRAGLRGDGFSSAIAEAVGTAGSLPFLSDFRFMDVLPGSLRMTAPNGSVAVAGEMALFPDPTGRLTLIARDSVRLAGTLRQSDQDARRLASVVRPQELSDISSPFLPLMVNQTAPHEHAATPVHADNPEPVRVVAETGDVTGNTNGVALVAATRSRVLAGRDIVDVGLVGQNLHAGDVTAMTAGRDFRFSEARAGNNRLLVNPAGIELGGPGWLSIAAGRDFDMGTSQGVSTRGALGNPALPAEGSGIRIQIGTAAQLDVAAFLGSYLDNAARSHDLLALMRAESGNAGLGPEEAWALFAALPEPRRTALALQVAEAEFWRLYLQAEGQPGSRTSYLGEWQEIEASLPADASERERIWQDFKLGVFWREMRAGGRDAAPGGATPGDYGRFYAAPLAMGLSGPFHRHGDLNMIFSQIKTERGGPIEIVVPGGGVNVGLATLPAGFDRPASDLGIITLGGGHAYGLVRDHFQVNQSRIFTVAGGDILLASLQGNIDAGRGKKTPILVPPPITLVDPSTGKVVVEHPPTATGSGIAALRTRDDIPVSDVDLIAPAGEVNAGDAGIRSSGRVSIAAQRVVGADNIQAAGPVIGVPVQSAPAIAAPAPATPTNESRLTEQATAATAGSTREMQSILTVEVLAMGAGEAAGGCAPQDEECLRRQRAQ